MPDIVSSPLISTLERYLSLTSQSQQRITSNMANIDTPGYHTRDIDFQAEMHRAVLSSSPDGTEMDSSGLDSAGFENASYGSAAPRLTPAAHEVKGLLERPDGNNVSLDREGMMLSRTQLQFQVGEQLVKHEFHQLLSAINGGGN